MPLLPTDRAHVNQSQNTGSSNKKIERCKELGELADELSVNLWYSQDDFDFSVFGFWLVVFGLINDLVLASESSSKAFSEWGWASADKKESSSMPLSSLYLFGYGDCSAKRKEQSGN